MSRDSGIRLGQARPESSFVQRLPIFLSEKIFRHVLGSLQGTDPGDDRPAVLGRHLHGVAGHLAEAVRHDVEEVARTFGSQAVHVEGIRALEAALHDHALTLARPAVARRAEDVEALLAAQEERAREWHGDLLDEFSVGALAAPERGVCAEKAAGRGAVRKERAFAERLDLGLVMHVVPAAADEENEKGHASPNKIPAHQSSTSETWLAPSVSMKRNVSPARKRGSRARTIRKYRSREASWKRGTEKTGWYGIGRPFSTSMPSTAAMPAKRIVHSNVIGMKETQLLYGRPPMFSGKSTAEVQYWRKNPKRPPRIPPIRVRSGTREGPWPMASCSSSIG